MTEFTVKMIAQLKRTSISINPKESVAVVHLYVMDVLGHLTLTVFNAEGLLFLR